MCRIQITLQQQITFSSAMSALSILLFFFSSLNSSVSPILLFFSCAHNESKCMNKHALVRAYRRKSAHCSLTKPLPIFGMSNLCFATFLRVFMPRSIRRHWRAVGQQEVYRPVNQAKIHDLPLLLTPWVGLAHEKLLQAEEKAHRRFRRTSCIFSTPY